MRRVREDVGRSRQAQRYGERILVSLGASAKAAGDVRTGGDAIRAEMLDGERGGTVREVHGGAGIVDGIERTEERGGEDIARAGGIQLVCRIARERLRS